MNDKLTRRAAIKSLAGIGAVSLAGTAAAQESTPTPTPDEEGGGIELPELPGGGGDRDPAPSTPEPPQYVGEIDATTRIVDYRVRGKQGDETARWTVELELDVPTLITLADPLAGILEEGVTTVETRRVNLPRGKGEVRMEAVAWEGDSSAIAIATPRGQVYLSEGLERKKSPEVALPFGAAVGLGTGAVGMFGAAWRKKHNERDAPQEAWEDDGGLL